MLHVPTYYKKKNQNVPDLIYNPHIDNLPKIYNRTIINNVIFHAQYSLLHRYLNLRGVQMSNQKFRKDSHQNI